MGLGDPAEAELRAIGLAPPTDKKKVDDPDRVEQLWALAWLYDKAGRYSASHWPTRWHILDYKRQWPIGADGDVSDAGDTGVPLHCPDPDIRVANPLDGTLDNSGIPPSYPTLEDVIRSVGVSGEGNFRAKNTLGHIIVT